MSIEADDPRLSFIPVEEALVPPPGVTDHVTDRWWIVHPDKGLVIWKGFSRQCSHDRRIAESVRDRLYPWASVIFVNSVFLKYQP